MEPVDLIIFRLFSKSFKKKYEWNVSLLYFNFTLQCTVLLGKCASDSENHWNVVRGQVGTSDNSKTVYEIEKKLGWSDKKLIFLSYQPSIFFIFYAILKILRVPSKKRQFIFNFIMTFSPGQNGKGGEKIKQMGKLKKNGFCKQKGGTKDNTRPSF